VQGLGVGVGIVVGVGHAIVAAQHICLPHPSDAQTAIEPHLFEQANGIGRQGGGVGG